MELGNVAAVTQLVGNAFGLISNISKAAETARQNKVECENLASSVSTIGGVLSHLPQDPEAERPLAKLMKVLEEAHRLVVSCQKGSTAINQLLGASHRADKLREANARILSEIAVLNLSLLSYIACHHVTGLVSKINDAAEMARRNKVECKHLARSVSTIREVLSHLPPDSEVARPLADLKDTLQEAHGLVVGCQKRSLVNQLFRARRRANRFREINARITSDISVLNLSLHIAERRQASDQTVPSNGSYFCSLTYCFSGIYPS